MIRVLIVDNSFFMRRVISDMLSTDSEIEVVGEAVDGIDALKKIDTFAPDVVTLDLHMPTMDGMETLNRIMKKESPPAVIMVSGYTHEGATVTLQCLNAGAVDFILKPSGEISLDMQKVKEAMIYKIKVASATETAKVKNLGKNAQYSASSSHPSQNRAFGVVVIGSSTGGPVALENILPQFPQNYPYPILIAQHLPAKFTKSFALRLAKICLLSVHEARDGEIVTPGTMYIAPGQADTMVVKKENGQIELAVRENEKDILTPSVNKLMQSAASVYQEDTIGIILTGMGSDGLLGSRAIKEAGGKTYVQDAQSSVVYGMGKEVVDAGLADNVLTLSQIVPTVIKGGI